MDLFTHDALQTLVRKQTSPCVSLFMPTHRAGQGIRQDPIRLKNMLSEVRDELIASGMRAADARNMTASGEALVNDGNFWRNQSDGLALFIAPDLFHIYSVPLAFDELVVVSDTFHLKPLLPLLTGDGRFFVLDLNQNNARLYEGTRFSMSEVDLGGMATGMAETLQSDQREQQLQFHTSAAKAGGGERRAMFFGHGAAKESARNNILRFFQQLDSGIASLLRDEKAPLVLAGVEELHPIFRETNSYKHLFEEGITVHAGALDERELHARAWSLVAPFFSSRQRERAGRYKELSGTGLTSDSIANVLPASGYGRIDALFVVSGRQQWGRFDPSANTVIVHDQKEPGDEDVLNAAVVETLLHDGDVYVVPPEEMPSGNDVAAVFRY